MTSRLIQSMIAIVIGLALLPVVHNFADELTGTGGVLEGTTTGAMVDLIPILYVIVLVAGVVSYVVVSAKR